MIVWYKTVYFEDRYFLIVRANYRASSDYTLVPVYFAKILRGTSKPILVNTIVDMLNRTNRYYYLLLISTFYGVENIWSEKEYVAASIPVDHLYKKNMDVWNTNLTEHKLLSTYPGLEIGDHEHENML